LPCTQVIRHILEGKGSANTGQVNPKHRTVFVFSYNYNWRFLQSCIGQERCGVSVVPDAFGGDPCPGTMKRAVVEAICG
jgi:hypothetical protein